MVASANEHDRYMDDKNQMSHQLPGEPDFATRVTSQGVSWSTILENIGYTSDNSNSGVNGALALHSTMMSEGPPPKGEENHYSNILDPSVNHIGISVIWSASEQKLWLTEDFADE